MKELRRWWFLLGAGAVLAAPIAAYAQPRTKLVRIGVLVVPSASDFAARTDALRAGLRDLGYVEGKSILIELRSAEGAFDRLPELAAELVRQDVDVLVVAGTPAIRAARPPDFDGTFASIGRIGHRVALVIDDPITISNARALADLAVKHRLATGGNFIEHAEAGGLMAYGVDLVAMWRRAASFVDKILKGTSPGEIPVERATRFELVINRKTATAIEVNIAPAILMRADRRIE